MAEYKSRRERRRTGGAAEKPHHGMAIIIAVAPKKKKKAGGIVEGEKARAHLGRRARGGRAHGGNVSNASKFEVDDGSEKSPLQDRDDKHDQNTMDDSPPVTQRAQGGHIDLHGNRVEHPDGHEEVHRQRQNRDQPIDQVMSYRKGGEIERTPSGGVKAGARHKAEAKGHTMPGGSGSFPINSSRDLANAKHDVGRAKDPEAARRWINKRARELGEPGLGG